VIQDASARILKWRRMNRGHVVDMLFSHTAGLTWTPRLMKLLLNELYVLDDVERQLGPIQKLPSTSYPQAVAIALISRHSWAPSDLEETVRQLHLHH
jgi:hypothetical protein